MQRELANQYSCALTMLKGVVDETDEAVWGYSDTKKVAAWQIAYHAVYYANIYCSPSEESIKRWAGQTDLDHFFETPWPPHARLVPDHAMAKADIIAFIDFVLGVIPEYLAHLEPEQPCWPHWYHLNQLEFHLNNLRHIQHHTAVLIERNGGSSVGWPSVG